MHAHAYIHCRYGVERATLSTSLCACSGQNAAFTSGLRPAVLDGNAALVSLVSLPGLLFKPRRVPKVRHYYRALSFSREECAMRWTNPWCFCCPVKRWRLGLSNGASLASQLACEEENGICKVDTPAAESPNRRCGSKLKFDHKLQLKLHQLQPHIKVVASLPQCLQMVPPGQLKLGSFTY